MRLIDADEDVIATTTTDADGLYTFADPDTGTYSIEVVVPEGLELVEQDVGLDDEIDSDVDPTTGRSDPFAYSSGTISRGHDAGLRLVAVFVDGFESGDTGAWDFVSP